MNLWHPQSSNGVPNTTCIRKQNSSGFIEKETETIVDSTNVKKIAFDKKTAP